MTDAAAEPRPFDPNDPTIVAIGASAGGIQALQVLFSRIPENIGASYVVIMHLDPEHHSDLDKIIAARTKIPVLQVEDRQPLRPDCIYVVPPNRQLQIIDHELSAIPFAEPMARRSSVDLFLRSVAERLGEGFAVILSGASADGSAGVKAVKAAGGIILVQEPTEAEFGAMPRSAIATGVADFVLPVQELATRLVDLVKLKRLTPVILEGPQLDEDLLRLILAHVRVRTGHDFSRYKRSTVLRRIARRMQMVQTGTLKDYYNFLRDNGEEAKGLLADLLISVTTFFRDREAFEGLKLHVLPGLFEGRDPGDTIRVWVPGCATGEEAYTLGILLLEEASRHDRRPAIQVFGSDLDGRVLATAREGRYPQAIETDVTEDRVRRFFIREGDGYRVKQDLRDIALFALHDLLKDPPFSRVDLISCRNLMIYLDRDLQEQVCSTFHYSLRPGGHLLLGSSESADNPPGLFRLIDRNARLFQSTALAGDKPRLLPRLFGPVTIRAQSLSYPRMATPTTALLDASRHRAALERSAPPSFTVDEAHRAVHLSDSVGRFIAPSGGALSADAVDLVRPELRFELRTALNRAFDDNTETVTIAIPVQFNGERHRVHLLVKPVPRDESNEPPQAIVMFIEGGPIDLAQEDSDGSVSVDTVRRLAQELETSQTRLRAMREESNAANEELRAANEELQSINEEYRSTSEELETSKEELQSINEELQTVNIELKLKLEAISRAHSDLQNLMAATDFGTLFLDPGLRVKRFTDRVTEIFSITLADEGRPITDFAHQLDYDDLIKHAQGVLANLAPVRQVVPSRAGRWYDVRIRPYRAVDDKIDGVVLTFVDITEHRQIEETLRGSESELRQQKRLVDLSSEPIFIWDFDAGIIDWNRGCEVLYGYSGEEARGARPEEILRLDPSAFAAMKDQLLKQGSWNGERVQKSKDGREITVETRLQLESFDDRRLVLESTHDISHRKKFEARQTALLHELSHRVRNALAVVQAIARQTLRNSPSPKEFVARFDGRLAALAAAHDCLMQSNWEGADLAALARYQLAPYMNQEVDRVHMQGEPVALHADLATPFALVFHELATNAAKYGAFSSPAGKVDLRWSVSWDDPEILQVVWQELDGPRVESSGAPGLGSRLIETAIPESVVTRSFAHEGMVCTIRVPLMKRRGSD